MDLSIPPDEIPERHEIHPMLIDHVVENILDYMEPELLGYHCKIFRLVCKDWSRIATKVYKSKRGRVNFKKNFIGRVSGLFIRVMKTSVEIPFDKFKFCSDSYDNEHFDELLHVLSGAITSLELNLVNPCNLRFPKRYPSLILGKLKTLIFYVRIECQKPLQIEMPSLLESLLEASPSLEALDIKVFGGLPRTFESILHFNTIVRKFGDILSQKSPHKMRSLRINMTLTDDQLKNFTSQPLRINSLDMYFQQSKLSAENMEQFLAKFAPGLIKCKPLGNQFLMNGIKFPIFPSLQYLVASGKGSENSVQYSKLFPELHTLEVCLWDDDPNTKAFSRNCASNSLIRVKFPSVVTTPKVFSRLASCYPNLKELIGITLGSVEGMKMMFKSLVTLEVLDLTLGHEFQNGTTCMDSILTGIPLEACAAIMKYREFESINSNKSCVESWNGTESIRNLKELRKLSICVPPLRLPSNVKLTDVSIYYGFMQLKNLIKLHLDYFPVTEIALEKLKGKVYLTRPC